MGGYLENPNRKINVKIGIEERFLGTQPRECTAVMNRIMEWQEIYGNWVILPAKPIAIVHFLGGAFVATAPQITYRLLLEQLAQQGYAVVATPFVNTFDHAAIARQVLLSFDRVLDYLQDNVFKKKYLPIYGIGHSMGCKLHLLINSLFEEERAGNIFISFNNYPARRSIPFLDQFSQVTPLFNVEFTPSPEETSLLIEKHYQVRRNLLIRFTDDTIDQTESLTQVVKSRFPDLTTLQVLHGNHLTPLGQDIRWQTGSSYAPWDAIGQFVKQEMHRDLNRLHQSMLLWLNPFSGLQANR